MTRSILVAGLVTVLAAAGAFVAGRGTREAPRAPDAPASAITVETIDVGTWELTKPSLADLVTPG